MRKPLEAQQYQKDLRFVNLSKRLLAPSNSFRRPQSNEDDVPGAVLQACFWEFLKVDGFLLELGIGRLERRHSTSELAYVREVGGGEYEREQLLSDRPSSSEDECGRHDGGER